MLIADRKHELEAAHGLGQRGTFTGRHKTEPEDHRGIGGSIHGADHEQPDERRRLQPV